MHHNQLISFFIISHVSESAITTLKEEYHPSMIAFVACKHIDTLSNSERTRKAWTDEIKGKYSGFDMNNSGMCSGSEERVIT